jgi:hypothetical protein
MPEETKDCDPGAKHPLGHCPECLAPGLARNRSTGEVCCANVEDQHHYQVEQIVKCCCK